MIWLIRHAETEWSKSGRHTGRSDIPLTENGERAARDLAPRLTGHSFAAVFSSPRSRAMRTAELVGLGAAMKIEPDLAEWDYGEYEGLTSAQIKERHPGWDLWRHGVIGGETLAEIRIRACRVIDKCLAVNGDVALFSHGHFSRCIACAWLELPPSRGRSFGLHAGSVSLLGTEHSNRVIWSWDWVPSIDGGGH